MIAMRLLLIDDDARYRALIRHHVTCRWPDADVVTYNPARRGPLPPELHAMGYGAVLLDESWRGGVGLDWLADLTTRPNFAPVIFLAETADSEIARRAMEAGAYAVMSKTKIDHQKLLHTIDAAVRSRTHALALWRNSAAGMESQQFGIATLRGYRCARELARGSVSDLYLAESEQAGGLVVLKITRALRKSSGIDQSFERFLQEYEILQQLRHPNVVRIHDLGVTDDYAFIVMEYFAAGDLRRRMREPLTTEIALTYALEIARALEAVHAAGVLHRDLKPGNVMVRDDGTLALIDFGLAKHEALAFEITDSGLIFGTPHYMSPEQGHGQSLDERSDLYSLGVILYEMLARSKPYVAENPMAIIYQHAKAPIPTLPTAVASVQPIIEKLLAKDPSNRFANAAEAARDLERALAARQLDAVLT